MTPAGPGRPGAPERFDPAGPLPGPGVTVLEASAGTGKTFALTSLVTRYVAEGVPLSAILAVTFTKIATGELRDRIRRRLVEVLRALAVPGSGPPSGDAFLSVLLDGGPDVVASRRQRLAAAVSDFDAATIATTHGFCQMVLHGLGSAGNVAPGAVLLEDSSDLVDQVVDDLYLRRALRHGPPPFDRATARRAARAAAENPDTPITPSAGEDPAGLLGRLAVRARQEVARRLMDRGEITYDQLLVRLADTLEDPQRGGVSCRRLAERYQVVLVDEFQDTDPIQWRVLRRGFGGDRPSTLILIGDPKQAIYAFRGADVFAYLDAARLADRRCTLGQNWRADGSLIEATAALLDPVQFGHPDIPFRTVAPADGREGTGLEGAPGSAPLRFRLVAQNQPGIRITPAQRLLQKNALVEWIAADVADDVAGLLASGATIPDAAHPGGRRPIRPADAAILTRTNKQAVLVRDALRAAGVPSVVAGLDTVFATDAARHWSYLLEALQDPSSRARVAAAAMTPFIGMSALEVATAEEDRWSELHDRLHRWSGALTRRGVAPLYRLIGSEEGLPARVLSEEGGERLLTDLGHVAHLLHSESMASQMGGPALRAWLASRVRAAGEENADAEERSRRLDTDAEAVQVLTVHRAKGLEFPVVYCPYLWDPSQSDRASGPVVFHDPGTGHARTLDAGCPTDDDESRRRYGRHSAIARSEQKGEDLRLLYVALTRARHQVVVWWGRAKDSRHSPLARLLLCRDPGTGEVGDAGSGEPSDKLVRAALETVAGRAGGAVSVEAAGTRVGSAPDGPGAQSASDRPEGQARRAGGAPSPAPLSAAAFGRRLDLTWRRASYTSLTAPSHGAGRDAYAVGSEPEAAGLEDEPEPAPEDASAGAQPAEASAWDALPAGADFGIFVHRLLERTDFAAEDLEAEVAAAAQSVGRRPESTDPSTLVEAVVRSLRTPLGHGLESFSLSRLTRPDRIDEMVFELPVAGGDRPVGQIVTSQIADLVEAGLEPGGPLGGYPARLRDPLLQSTLRGYLTGSMDLVFRRPGADGEPLWYLVDYKTNRLGPGPGPAGGGSVRRDPYGERQLEAEMIQRHYPLQALLYLVALHRYLRWRQPGYRPDAHLGGVAYLFLRGMRGETGPSAAAEPDESPPGIFWWQPPAQLVTALSDLLHSAAGSDPGHPARAGMPT